MPDIKLLNIDCMEFMKDCKDKEFDLAIVDPPYGIGMAHGKSFRGDKPHKSWKGRKVKMTIYDKKEWDLDSPDENYFEELLRISKNQIIWGANHFLGWASSCWIVWDKLVTDNSADCELAWTSFDTAVRKFTWLWNGYKKGEPEDRIHPTQKPVKLYKWLLKNYAKEGDKIFDSHGGSMSIAIACHYMNFDLTLCEIDKDYYEAGVKRYNEAIKQQTLFDFNHSTIK